MRLRLSFIAMVVACAALLAACGSSSSSSTTSSPASTTNTGTTPQTPTIGFEGVPLETGGDLAPATTTNPTGAVDGITCAPLEQLAYHIHAHLHVFADGESLSLPAGIGILNPVVQQTPYGPVVGAGNCFYWLHTHTSDGVIHIESPTQKVYTLGNFFDVWGEPLTSTRVASVAGKVTAYVDGKLWTKSPGAIPLLPHTVIQLDVGSTSPAFQPVSFAGTTL